MAWRELLRDMLRRAPAARPTAAALRTRVWFLTRAARRFAAGAPTTTTSV